MGETDLVKFHLQVSISELVVGLFGRDVLKSPKIPHYDVFWWHQMKQT